MRMSKSCSLLVIKMFVYINCYRSMATLSTFPKLMVSLNKICDETLFQKLMKCSSSFSMNSEFRIQAIFRMKQEVELQTYLNHLIDEDLCRKLKACKEKESREADEDAVEDVDMEEKEQALKMEAQTNKDQLNNLFAQVPSVDF